METGTHKRAEIYKGLTVLDTVTPSEVPKGCKVIGCRPGETIEHKVRLVVKGFMQVAGINYMDTFAPVAQMEGIHAIMHIDAQCN